MQCNLLFSNLAPHLKIASYTSLYTKSFSNLRGEPVMFMKLSISDEDLFLDRPQYDFEYVSSICHGRHDGTYQDVTDCSRYFHCTNGRPYRMRCPEGTLWNDGLKTCTFNLDPNRPNPCAIPDTFNYYVGYGARVVKPFLLQRTDQLETLKYSPPNDWGLNHSFEWTEQTLLIPEVFFSSATELNFVILHNFTTIFFKYKDCICLHCI